MQGVASDLRCLAALDRVEVVQASMDSLFTSMSLPLYAVFDSARQKASELATVLLPLEPMLSFENLFSYFQ